MGFYIQGPVNAKAEYLLKEFGATVPDGEPTWPPPEGKAYVCVVKNGMFDAAAYAYDEKEFRRFAKPGPTDHRPRRWLVMDKAVADKFSGYADAGKQWGDEK